MTHVADIHGYIKPRVPRAGKIRLGVTLQSQKGNPYPKEVDYFVLDADLPGRDTIVGIYGEKPKRILVTFLSDDPRDILPIAYKAYGRGVGLLCKGDGKTAHRADVVEDEKGHRSIRRDARGQPMSKERSCTCEWLEQDKCKAMGNLLVVLPEVGVEHYQIDTSSWHSHQNLRNDLRHFAEVFQGGEEAFRGRLFWLSRVPQETHGSGRKETHWPMRLTLPTPEEYRGKLESIGAWVGRYRSLMHGLPPGDAEPNVAALPPGSPVEEADLVRERDMVDADVVRASRDVEALLEESLRGRLKEVCVRYTVKAKTLGDVRTWLQRLDDADYRTVRELVLPPLREPGDEDEQVNPFDVDA